MTNLDVDVFKYCDSFITELFIRSGVNHCDSTLSPSLFVALDWESTDDKLRALHINRLDCCMYATYVYKTEKTKVFF